jgi:hypothetical protein
MCTATFPWLTAMLATKQSILIGPALDLGGWEMRARGVRHAWSARRWESGHWPGSSRRPCEPEANEQGPVGLRGEPSGQQGRVRSRERCARTTAQPEALGRLSCGVRFPGPILHLLRCDVTPDSRGRPSTRARKCLYFASHFASRGPRSDTGSSWCATDHSIGFIE